MEIVQIKAFYKMIDWIILAQNRFSSAMIYSSMMRNTYFSLIYIYSFFFFRVVLGSKSLSGVYILWNIFKSFVEIKNKKTVSHNLNNVLQI